RNRSGLITLSRVRLGDLQTEGAYVVLTRRLYFYRANLAYFETSGGETTERRANPRRIVDGLAELPWEENANPSAYQPDGDGYVAVQIDQISDKYAMGQLAKSRRTGLPRV